MFTNSCAIDRMSSGRMFGDQLDVSDLKGFLEGFDVNLDKDDVGAKADQIARGLEESKSVIYEKLEKKFAECKQCVQEANDLCKDVEILCERAEKVKDDMTQQLTLAKELSPVEIDSLAFKLERSNKVLSILIYMKSLSKNLQELQNFINGQRFIEATKSLKAIRELKGSPAAVELFKFFSIKESKHICNLHKMEELLQEKLTTKLHDLFAVKIPQMTYRENEITKISFLNQVDANLWWEILKSMKDLSILEPKIKKLSNNMMKVFERVVSCKAEVTINGNFLLLERVISERKDVLASSRKVVENVGRVIDFLGQGLRCNGENKTLCMEMIGNLIAEKILCLLNQDIIKTAIPCSLKNLQDFRDLISHVQEYQKLAQEFEFIPHDKDYVSLVIGDAETAFVTKKCEDLLFLSRSLLKEPLHITIEVGDDPPEEIQEAEGGEDLEHLSAFTLEPMFTFPRCQISASVQKIWDLIEDLLLDFSESHLAGVREVGIGFYKTIRKVLQLYISIVPLQHKEEIQSLPLLPAIHHNNCMFLSHFSVLTEVRLKAVFTELPPTSSFMDFVLTLRKMASDTLQLFVSQQKGEIIKDLNLLSGYENISENENFNEFNKSIDKVLFRLEHLNNIWLDVLPPIFQALIGFLLNSCLEEVIKNVIRLEDISETDGQQFVTVIAKLEKFGDKHFPPHDDGKLPALKCIKSWTKLKELKFVLNARLIEIRDRWASGKGPLAEEFTSEELDHLVRSLFQNTDMRAVVLATINNC